MIELPIIMSLGELLDPPVMVVMRLKCRVFDEANHCQADCKVASPDLARLQPA